MTVEKMLGAHRAFRELLELRLPYERVRQLHRLAAWLEEELAIYCAEEHRAAEQCGAAILQNGELHFPDAAAQEKYIQRIQEVRETAIDGWPPVTLTEEDLAEQKITLRGILELEGFVEFGGEELGTI